MFPPIRMAFEIIAPVFGIALALTLMLYLDRTRDHRAAVASEPVGRGLATAWTFVWVSACLVGALVFGGVAAWAAWQGFTDIDGKILDAGTALVLLAVALCLAYFSRHRSVRGGALWHRHERDAAANSAPTAFERRKRAESTPVPGQVDSLAVVTGRFETGRERAAHDADVRKELVEYLGWQIARRKFGDPEAQVIDGYILAVFESRAIR
jgi:hypothetical protein